MSATSVRKISTESADGQPSGKLLEPGWAGELSDSELDYIQRRLKRSPRLWRRWGYLGAMLKGVTIPASTIRRIASHGL
jgi:hypothetical protein